MLHDVSWHISAPCCFQRTKSPSNSIRKYCLDLLSMVALCCSAIGGRYMLITKTLSRQASMWSMLSFAFLGMYQLHVAFRDQNHPARLQQSHQKPWFGPNLPTHSCGMLLKAVGSVYGDVKRAHGLLHGSWIARIARTARSCTDLHGVARTARRARRARTAQTARTARTARTLHGLHGPHGQHGLQREHVQLTPSPHYWV